jgi:hypothetical protein
MDAIYKDTSIALGFIVSFHPSSPWERNRTNGMEWKPEMQF